MMSSSADIPTNVPVETSNFEQSNVDSTATTVNSTDPADVTHKSSRVPKRKRNPFILLPLYIWPGTGVWDPLFEAAEANPDLDLWVIINPFNGPGLNVLPEANYIEVLSRLTAVPNAKLIGYVRCDYGRRPMEEILAEIDKYASWGKELANQGDERVCPCLLFPSWS